MSKGLRVTDVNIFVGRVFENWMYLEVHISLQFKGTMVWCCGYIFFLYLSNISMLSPVFSTLPDLVGNMPVCQRTCGDMQTLRYRLWTCALAHLLGAIGGAVARIGLTFSSKLPCIIVPDCCDGTD